ncbi:oxysterol binding protein [Pholiota conissans]|uniref:Oxysterol binding protein n=1 Tax=Pholiota conissans TaxID=109636 RepID=A0A9P5Z276_9AGAR|nr:oxysterol binding protein [Pholiota conissans]
MAGPPVLYEGWVLKKRRKKMQGFARRYFTLYQSGLLSYAFEPGQPIRDQIHLNRAAISTAPGRKDIHIDSNTATFHIKCLSTDDFNDWMSAFRKFISTGIEAKKVATYRQASRQASISLNRSGVILEEMGNMFNELEGSIANLSLELNPQKFNSLNKKSDKPLKESKFGLFKRLQDGNVDGHSSHPLTFTDPLQDIRTKLDALKVQYSTLVKVLQTPLHDTPQQMLSPLPSTLEEEEEMALACAQRVNTPVTHKSLRDSVTTMSDSFVEWFDAEDEGPQEFIMDAGLDMSEPPSRMLSVNNDNATDSSSIDTDYEEALTASVSGVVQANSKSSGQLQVVRRTQLPALPPADEGSLFAILKKNDLSSITFPVTFNEPLTLLQRAAEELEYFTLLDDAAKTTDPISRMAYVAAFAVSGYAHTRHRSGRKGFNPMLAETFEDIRMKFIAEKVRHNPLEIAYHAEGSNWELNSTSCGKTKFWGKSFEIIPLGITTLKIGTDTYVWKKPSSFIRNLMVGTKYFEHTGKMIIENTTTQHRCVLDFKQNGYWGPTNVVSGTIHDINGEIAGQLDGKWDDQMCQILDASHLHVLWKANPFPKNTLDSYGFTSYGITLNEVTSDLIGKLPPTDSRLREDVRALENAELDFAEQEKLRIEQVQRDRRQNGQERQPRWFKQVGDDWQYVGGYWESRARGWQQEDIAPLW